MTIPSFAFETDIARPISQKYFYVLLALHSEISTMNHHSLVSSKQSERALESSQTNQSRRSMQAPTSLQASNHIGGPTTQHGMYALPLLNAQQTTYSYDAPTIERPSNGLDNRGLNARTGFNVCHSECDSLLHMKGNVKN